MNQNGRTAAVLGATGNIGQNVVRALIDSGFSVRIFARDTEKSRQIFPQISEHVSWDYRSEAWKDRIDGCNVVINLAGAPIFQKWKGHYRSEIVDSRVEETRQVVDAIRRARDRPQLLINASAAGIYGYESFDNTDVTEDTLPGKDFWGDFVTRWEHEALEAESMGVRTVLIRTSVVLSTDGGALPQLVSVFKKGIGGPISPGNQWFPWIHVDDEVGLLMFSITNDRVKGPLNASSPKVPTMKEFATALGITLGKTYKVRIPITFVRLMMGEVGNILAKGKKVVPKRAEEFGYVFKYPDLEQALDNLLKK